MTLTFNTHTIRRNITSFSSSLTIGKKKEKRKYVMHRQMIHAHACQNTSITELTTEFTLIIRLGEPLISDGKSKIESNAGAR